MKCNDIRTFLSQIAGKTVSVQVQPSDLNFLSTNGYLSVMPKDEYDRTSADVANLMRMNQDLQNKMMDMRVAEAALLRDQRKTHSILFHFEGRDKKESELQTVAADRSAVAKDQADILAEDSKIRDLIQKKSMIDRMVSYDGEYVSLTGLGVITLNDLNIRNYRVSDNDFSQFIAESRETSSELRSIAQGASFQEAVLKMELPLVDPSQTWSVAIGLAKLQADQNQISQRFRLALMILQHFKSTIDNKMMAAEILTAFRHDPGVADNSDLQALSKSLSDLDKQLRHHFKVPKQLSAGVAAVILFGRRYDGTYPTDRYAEFSRMTRSSEAAAILSVVNLPTDQLAGKFQGFRTMFNLWGFQTSEDTELSSAYLSISDLGVDDVRTKMVILLNALRPYLEYPLVAAAILATIPTLEANETLDLTEKAFSTLSTFAPGLERSELLSLSVRMIHGIKNELVKQLDPTAKLANTPVQFTHVPSNLFFIYRAPLIVAHSSYYATFGSISGVHPAHVHSFGGGFGG